MIKKILDAAQSPKRASTHRQSKIGLLGLAMGLFLFWGSSIAQAADCPDTGSCTAGDVKLDSSTVTAPATCVQGEMVTVIVTANLSSTAAQRYSGALYLVNDKTANQCTVGPVDDGDSTHDCGNLLQDEPKPAVITTQVLCDGLINEKLNIPAIAAWSNKPADEGQCLIGNGAKCDATLVIETNITVITPAPALTVTKTASPLIYTAAVGQTITYDYTVTNTGNVTIDTVKLDDDKLPADAPNLSNCEAASLAPTESTTCSATYTITVADLAAGTVTNIATATGTYNGPSGAALVFDTDTETVNAAKLTLDKSASPSVYEAAGTLITYSFVLTNTGLVDLSNVSINDPTLAGLGVSITCPATTLAAGANMTCTAAYTTTADDFAALKTIVNTATAGALAGRFPVPSNQDTATVIGQAPAEPVQNSMTITKSANPTSYSAAGVVVTYTFTVKNTGDGTINNIVVTDSVLGVIAGA